MHIHVSSPAEYTLPELASVIKGTLFYDAPITRIMPPGRKNSPWAQSNVRMQKLWIKQVDEVPDNSWAPIFDPLDKAKMKGGLVLGLCDDRYVSWNFAKSLYPSTVEFRRPPPAQTAAAAIHWAAFALGFIANAMAIEKWGDVKILKRHPTTAELRAAVRRGIQRSGANSQGALGPIEDIDATPTVLSAPEKRRIEDLKKAKKNKKSVFVEKLSSRPNTPTSVKAAA